MRRCGRSPRNAMRGGRLCGVRWEQPGLGAPGGQRLPIRVPRVRGEEGEIPLRAHAALQGSGEVDEVLLRRVLYGISCRNYAAAEAVPGAIGPSLFGAACLCAGERGGAQGVSGARSFRGGRCDPVPRWKELCRGHDGGGARGELGGGQALLAVCGDRYRERAAVDPLPAVAHRAGARSLRGSARGHRWGQGVAGRDPQDLRTSGEWHKRENVVGCLSKGETGALARTVATCL